MWLEALGAACVGAGSIPGPDSTVTILGERPGDRFGSAVAPAGDVNGDGWPDLIFGAPSYDTPDEFAGRCYLFHGPFDATELSASEADASFVAEAFADNLGVAVAGAGDLNADGFGDLVMGARSNDAGGIQAGRVYVFHGPVAGETHVLAADAVISGTAFEEVGWSLSGGFDLNDDGTPDLAMGAPEADNGLFGGAAHVFFGPIEGDLSTADADVTITASVPFEVLGESVATADLNADGKDDLVVGGPAFPIDQLPPGRTYVFFGPIEGTFGAAQADVVIEGTGANDAFGKDVSHGDVNADGQADLIVGADQFYNANAGRAYVFHGPLTPGFKSAGSADVIVTADDFEGVTSGSFGFSVAGVGDTDGDGVGEILVGDPDAAVAGDPSGEGQAYLFRGPLPGELNASDADALIPGGPDDELGDAVAGVGDVDADGLADFLIGAPASAFSKEKAGLAVLVLSGGCAADFNGDGSLDVLDFVALQEAFMAGDESADIDGDGRLTIVDFLAFQDLFLMGC